MLSAVYERNKKMLWGLCYRLTASAHESEDLVQETFVRAVSHPPPDTERDWRPWLMRVATNLALDALRARKSRVYTGPWLPALVDSDRIDDAPSPEARYSLRESATIAFLLALEALTPQQRAVLVLRDVFDCSARETADALELSEDNTKQLLHRARDAMASYDRERIELSDAVWEAHAQALHALMAAVMSGDRAAVVSLLRPNARAVQDAGGEFKAALREVVGADRVARLSLGLAQKSGIPQRVAAISVNGLPALWLELEPRAPSLATRVVTWVRVVDGKIAEIDTVVASGKLRALREWHVS